MCVFNIPDAVSLRCLSSDLDTSSNCGSTASASPERDRETGGDDIGELNQRGGRIMEGGTEEESDKEGERRGRRDGKTERD